MQVSPMEEAVSRMQEAGNLHELFGGIDIYLFDQLLKGRITPGMKVLDAGCGSGRNLVYFLRSGYEVFGVDESEEAIAQVRRLAARLAPRLPAENFRVEAVERMSWGKADRRPPTVDGAKPPVERESCGRELSADYTDYAEGERADPRQPTVDGANPRDAGGTDKSTVDGRPSAVALFDVVLSSAVLHFARDEEQWQAMVSEMWRVLKPGGMFFGRLASTIGMENRVRLIAGRRYHLPDGSDRFLVDEAMLRRVTAELGGEFIEPIKTTVVENLRAMTTWVVGKSNE